MKNNKKSILYVVLIFIITLATILFISSFISPNDDSNTSSSDNTNSSSISSSEDDSSSLSNTSSSEEIKDTIAENIKIPNSNEPETVKTDEYKALWLTYLEYQNMDLSSKDSFLVYMEPVFKNCKDLGLNSIIVQVRPFGDALYNSSYFPSSHLLTGIQGTEVNYDFLEEMIILAKKYELRIEAWINPYRVSLHSELPEVLSPDNPGLNEDITFTLENGGIFYNPASEEARELVVNGVLEIVNNYDIDGIHFDDYFYPTTDYNIDIDDYNASGTSLSHDEWRRENVNILIRDVYSSIKMQDANIIFGISPQGNNDNNYNQQYSDVNLWLKEEGYADYITPQIYWGFDYLTASGREDYQFDVLLNEWASYEKHDDIELYIGLGAYRIGIGDGGANEQDEWSSGDNLSRMITAINNNKDVDGYALYRYDNLFNPSDEYIDLTNSEIENIKAVN